MTCRVGILRAECRPEGVNIPESLGERFSVELSAYSQTRMFMEEIPAVIDVSILLFRRI